ncbi:MAG: error-prone DNA polymerase [Thermoanaerobaculia bacterium]|nr:error-prone DNA polymerase [Thermoanaerobaculia bacterium]
MSHRLPGDDRDEPLPAPEPRTLGMSLGALQSSPGARKEARQKRSMPSRRRAKVDYVELRVASAFSFLAASSAPEDLVERAAELGLPALALVDRNGVYGCPRCHGAARRAGIKALVGAEVALVEGDPPRVGRGPLGIVPPPGAVPSLAPPATENRLTLLAESRTGYRNLCRLLTAAARDRPKGQARASWELVAEHAEGLVCLSGGEEGPLAAVLDSGGVEAGRRLLGRLGAIFPGRLHLELQRHHRRGEEHRNTAVAELAASLRLPLLATNGVRYAQAAGKELQDVLTAIRHGLPLDRAGRHLGENRERHLKSPEEMAALFADRPQVVAASAELARRLAFTLEDLGYRFPDYPLPPGETPDSYLRHLTWNGARARFRPLTGRTQAQLERELALIEKLGLAGYFLIVWDIVRFCKEHCILAQGRGSAANSAVCYALSITAVDPVKMDLLFERFLSEERGEWPDIDLDLPSGRQRESVIQYVYGRYGPHGAAMTANVITYRDRSAARETAKALGFSSDQVDQLSKTLGHFGYDRKRGDVRAVESDLAAAGFDPEDRRVRLFARLWQEIQHLPRHLGQHSGGMVIAAGRLDEVVPLEPAAMAGRVVVQWDKDDCADLGIVKVDLLGLGMLNALEEAVPTIRTREGKAIDLAHLPPDDPKTYDMLRRADTVGVFQVESRAQMASLPRNRPERFYDLVIQVAIIRPGPIVGNLAHPFFERRQGRQPVTYAHPCLEPILERTLGIPLFQEQILKMAMVAAGFTGGEAEELRRAMGFKRSMDKMAKIEARLKSGMTERGLLGAAQEQVLKAIQSFALYGFPESHAASFALIAYASAYLKAHHPTAFVLSLLNAWPMGFYHPATLIQDAQRHGVLFFPIDIQHSEWRSSWVDRPADRFDPQGAGPAGAVRLGLRFVRGLRREAGERLVASRTADGPFRSTEDLAQRVRLRPDELATLASLGALGGLGLTRREALWQASRVTRPAGPLVADEPDTSPSPLTEMTAFEETAADYAATEMTIGRHPLAHLRPELDRHGVVPAGKVEKLPAGGRIRFAGSVIVRQRPGTAKGVLFLTLEDETGMAQAIVSPELLREHRKLVVGTAGLVIEGILQRKDGSTSVKAEKFWSLREVVAAKSHDFR